MVDVYLYDWQCEVVVMNFELSVWQQRRNYTFVWLDNTSTMNDMEMINTTVFMSEVSSLHSIARLPCLEKDVVSCWCRELM